MKPYDKHEAVDLHKISETGFKPVIILTLSHTEQNLMTLQLSMHVSYSG